MWFRGRTVLAMMVTTAITASMATYAYQAMPGWFSTASAPEPGIASAESENGIQKDELDKINKAMALIQRKYIHSMDRSQLLDGAIQGMIEALDDPYSVYKSKDEAQNFTDALEGAFTGIGAELRVDKGAIVVETAFRGSPAEKAGLQPRDVLLSVNGESLQGLTLSEAVLKIRGPKGTKAKLKVQRAGTAHPLELELVRDRIDQITVDAKLDSEGIGHLWINQFNYETSAQVAEQLSVMEQGGLKGLIIDVRDNPGGILQSVIEVADQLLEKGKPIVQFEYKDGQRKSEVAPNGYKSSKQYPIVVLMNKGSASAAEILAGALKQSANAVLVGETTYGKGTVQVSYDKELGDGSLVKLTLYKWLLPDGTWINEKGIAPDIAVSQPDYFLAARLPRDTVLEYDLTSEAVKNLQNILEGVGFPADRNDGYFSQETKSALEAFQLAESLTVTGKVSEETAQRLEERLYVNLQDAEYDTQWQSALAKAREMITPSAP